MVPDREGRGRSDHKSMKGSEEMAATRLSCRMHIRSTAGELGSIHEKKSASSLSMSSTFWRPNRSRSLFRSRRSPGPDLSPQRIRSTKFAVRDCARVPPRTFAADARSAAFFRTKEAAGDENWKSRGIWLSPCCAGRAWPASRLPGAFLSPSKWILAV